MAIVNNYHGHRGVEGNATEGTLPEENGGIQGKATEPFEVHEGSILKIVARILENIKGDRAYESPESMDIGGHYDIPGGEVELFQWPPESQQIDSGRNIPVEQILEVLRQLQSPQGLGVWGYQETSEHEKPSPMDLPGRYHSSEGPGEGIGGLYDLDGHATSPRRVLADRGDNPIGIVRSDRNNSSGQTGEGPEGSRGLDNRTDQDGIGPVHLGTEGGNAGGDEQPIFIVIQEEGYLHILRLSRLPVKEGPGSREPMQSPDCGESPRSEEIWSPIDVPSQSHGQNSTGSPSGTRPHDYGTDPRIYRGSRSGPTGDDPHEGPLLSQTVPERVRPERNERIDYPFDDTTLDETEKVHTWNRQLSRKYEDPQTGGISAKEREAGDNWQEFLQPDHVRDHLSEVFRY